jgi:hypothetical protein
MIMCSRQRTMITTKAVMDSLLDRAADVESLAALSRFRRDFHACLTARRDEIFELADAVLCADGPVKTLAGLSLAPEHRRGHGALYDAVSHGRIGIRRLRRSVAGLPLPRAADGRLMLAADVSNWLRPGAATSPERLFCQPVHRNPASPAPDARQGRKTAGRHRVMTWENYEEGTHAQGTPRTRRLNGKLSN